MKVKKFAAVRSDRPQVTITVAGKRGWHYAIKRGEWAKYREGWTNGATDNEEELWSCIHALQAIDYTADVTIRSTKAFLVNAFNQNLIQKWERAHWRTKTGKTSAHAALWCTLLYEIDRVTDRKGAKFVLVKRAHVKPRMHGK